MRRYQAGNKMIHIPTQTNFVVDRPVRQKSTGLLYLLAGDDRYLAEECEFELEEEFEEIPIEAKSVQMSSVKFKRGKGAWFEHNGWTYIAEGRCKDAQGVTYIVDHLGEKHLESECDWNTIDCDRDGLSSGPEFGIPDEATFLMIVDFICAGEEPIDILINAGFSPEQRLHLWRFLSPEQQETLKRLAIEYKKSMKSEAA